MKQLFFSAVLIFISLSVFSTVYNGKEANDRFNGTSSVMYKSGNDFPVYIRFSENTKLDPQKMTGWLKQYLQNPSQHEFKPFFEWNAPSGMQFIRFKQYFNGFEVENSNLAAQIRDGVMLSFSGNIYSSIEFENNSTLNETLAMQKAMQAVPAQSYKWQIPAEEAHLKSVSKNSASSWYPIGKLVIMPVKQDNGKTIFKMAWKFDIFAHKPMQRKYVWIDAENGTVIKTESRIQNADVPGSAVTKYSGTQPIMTEFDNGNYRLQETGRGGGIRTFNMNMTAEYGSATDFFDADNIWNNVNAAQDEVGTDAHFAAEKMYDYLLATFSYSSLDNANLPIVSYVHYNLEAAGYPDNMNAFWNGSSMNYGDGTTNGISPLTTLDIAGHEMMHGVTSFSANLVYQDESGALNEGFSDIFGTVLEFYAYPANADWTVGEDIGYAMRSLSDPNQYGKPDTYHGTNWVYDASDYGGVHTNCGVLAYWFYLLSEGGSGTNDIGNAYTVTGLGMSDAANVAFSLVTGYLPPDADYDLTRFFAMQAAVDIYGPCTPGVESVTNAMYAVGLGNPYAPSVVSDFSAPLTSACTAPLTVSFTNLSINASSFSWNFGDGNTSTDAYPVHTYNAVGEYAVTLISDGGTCGTDTKTVVDYVSVNPANPCVVFLPNTGTAATQTSCTGTFYDYGGPDGIYIDNSDSYLTISPSGASSVNLNFLSFDVEPGSDGTCDFDYFEIFDGPNTSSTLLGKYCNDTGSPGMVSSSGGSITVHFHTDGGLSLSGFEVQWTCNLTNSPPNAQFQASATSSCSGNIEFTDLSSNNPTQWLWDFGDGQTSTQQNPTHTYTIDNIYTVSLYVENAYGNNELVKTSYVTIVRPSLPIAENDTACVNQAASLYATGTGTPRWYDAQVNGNLLFTGSPFVTSPLTADEIYYVENAQIAQSQYVGSINLNSGGMIFTADAVHYLEFNCFAPVTLVSVSVNAGSAGNRTIYLKNSAGVILATRTVNIPTGVSRITLNIDLPVANGLRLEGPASPDLYRNDSGCNYPYTLSGILSIIGSSASTNPTGYYYFFYEWEIKGEDCYSPRIPVNVHVDTCSGIEPNLINGLSVFPVPVAEALNISNDGNIILEKYRITNALGQVVQENKMIENMIGVSELKSGIYIIELYTSETVYPVKFIKN